MVVRTSSPPIDPAWTVSELGLEDLMLAYLGRARSSTGPVNPGEDTK
jgi:ABC-2 type transport system ATP-binding protein